LVPTSKRVLSPYGDLFGKVEMGKETIGWVRTPHKSLLQI
jgi:hypothetical protein